MLRPTTRLDSSHEALLISSGVYNRMAAADVNDSDGRFEMSSFCESMTRPSVVQMEENTGFSSRASSGSFVGGQSPRF